MPSDLGTVQRAPIRAQNWAFCGLTNRPTNHGAHEASQARSIRCRRLGRRKAHDSGGGATRWPLHIVASGPLALAAPRGACCSLQEQDPGCLAHVL